jgi:hypothetical protein
MRLFVIALIVASASIAKADDRPVQIPCAVWGNMKSATAGVIQVSLTAGDGKTAKGFDGYDAAIKLADEKARVCRFGGTLKLADQFLATYQFQTGAQGCMLLVELHSKEGIIHDRKGMCAQVLCGNGMKIDNLKFTYDPAIKQCQGQRTPQPAP